MVIGYREAKSHRVVELAECPVLRPELTAILAPLRKLLIQLGQAQAHDKGKAKGKQKGKPGGKHAHAKLAADVELTLTDQGVDLGIKGLSAEGLTLTQTLLDFAQAHGLARLALDNGYGPEVACMTCSKCRLLPRMIGLPTACMSNANAVSRPASS